MKRLLEIAGKPERVVVGLNSGTSMDGIDALCVRIRGAGSDFAAETLAAETVAYPAELRATLLEAPEFGLATLTRLHRRLGEEFAAAALRVIQKAGLSAADVDLVGSHGQTVCHLPPGESACATFQAGDIDVIAEATGIVTVGDFRSRDVAAGGEGAPLVPYLDWLLFRTRKRTVCLNLGGIANATLVDGELDACRALDTGPGNMPLDLLARRITRGAEEYDPGGRLAAQGSVQAPLLSRLMEHPFLQKPPPRTTGREEFGQAFLDDLCSRNPDVTELDMLGTLTAFVARSAADAVERHLRIPGGPREIVVSGGGVHNITLLRHLKEAFFPVPVTPSGSYGIDPDFKEALLFAVLANERICGRASNVPAATGARWPVCLGKIAL